MAHRDEIVNYLNELLNISEFDDYCVNGLQVEGKVEIQKIALGVSVSQRLFKAAVEEEVDMIIVHHGLFWKNDPSPFSLTGIMKNRVALLLKNDLNLVAYHLPLDAHAKYGNNAQLTEKLKIKIIEPVDVGFLGKISPPMKRDEFLKMVRNEIHSEAQIFPYGAAEINQILVISGGSSGYYKLAQEKEADTFIGGDIKENIVRELEETGINYINAGHYNTEKFGVQALTRILAKQFNVKTEFIDIPNPV